MNESLEKEGKHIRTSVYIAAVISFTIGLLFLLQQFFSDGFCPGIQPQEFSGLYGVLLYPLFHSNLSHLFSNLPPLFFLTAGTFYYLPRKLFPSIIYIWLGSAVIIWAFARPGCHLGASGIIYGLAFMLATLGFMKKQRTLGAFALIIVFMYGSMVWGVLPQDGNVSWEGHAGGALMGILLAILWRKKPIYTETDDEEELHEEDSDDDDTFRTNTGEPNIFYHYRTRE